jgi:hypothetical protein
MAAVQLRQVIGQMSDCSIVNFNLHRLTRWLAITMATVSMVAAIGRYLVRHH